MVKLTATDEILFGELRDILRASANLLTPYTETQVPAHQLLVALEARLGYYDPMVTIAVVGSKGCGKSSVINAIAGYPVLPPDTTKDVTVVHSPRDVTGPVLRKATGKALAAGADGVLKFLIEEKEQWMEEFADRRVETPLPVIRPRVPDATEEPPIYAARWELLDSVSGVRKPIPTSIVSDVDYTFSSIPGDVMMYCVNATLIGTPHEVKVFDELISVPWSETTLERVLCTRTVFVLTHGDVITDAEDLVTNVHVNQRPVITNVKDLRAAFHQLVSDTFHVNVPAQSVVVLSSRNALHAKMVQRERPSIRSMYDYAEAMFGSTFMQTIDSMSEQELQRLVSHHSSHDGYERSGGEAIDTTVRMIDYNSVRHLMSSVAIRAAEAMENVSVALEASGPKLQQQLETDTEAVKELLNEQGWVVSAMEAMRVFTRNISDALMDHIHTAIGDFLAERLEDIDAVLQHRDLVWFKSRQACTVVEMQSALKKLEAFTRRYLKERSYLEERSVVGPSEADNEGTNKWTEFLNGNFDHILAAMEKEKLELVTNFNICACHHIKDEFTVFFPALVQSTTDQLTDIVNELLEISDEPLHQTHSRIGVALDSDAVLAPLLELCILEQDDRRLNNFLRDLPEHVALAAVDVSNQWYARHYNAGEPLDEGKMMGYLLESWRLTAMGIQPQQVLCLNTDDLQRVLRQLDDTLVDYVGTYSESLSVGITQQRAEIATDNELIEGVAQIKTAFAPLLERVNKVMASVAEGITHDIVAAKAYVEIEDTE